MNVIKTDDATFEVVDKQLFEQQETENDECYLKRISEILDKVTHFLCEETEETLHFTKGKIYDLQYHQEPEQLVVLNDKNEKSIFWMGVKGHLLIQK